MLHYHSSDICNEMPLNIAFSALLLNLIAHVTNKKVIIDIKIDVC